MARDRGETNPGPRGHRQFGELQISSSAATTTESSFAHSLGRERCVAIPCADSAARNAGDVSLQKGQRMSFPVAPAVFCMHALHAIAVGQHDRAHNAASAKLSMQMAHCCSIGPA